MDKKSIRLTEKTLSAPAFVLEFVVMHGVFMDIFFMKMTQKRCSKIHSIEVNATFCVKCFLLSLTEMSQHCLIDVLINNNPVFVSTSKQCLYILKQNENNLLKISQTLNEAYCLSTNRITVAN